jgi:cell division transport system permease protein
MFLLGLFIALFSWVNSWTDHVRKDVLVKVFFVQDASVGQINAVRSKVLTFPETKDAVFVSKEEALQRMKEKYPDLTRNLSSNPLPAAFEVTPKNADQVKALADKLQPLPAGVDKIDYAEKKTERILAVTNVIKYIFLLGSVILLIASTILIANTIRLSIFARRREVEVMKLVGATDWFIRWPFVIEGVVLGALGGIVAILLLLVGKIALLDPLIEQFALLAAPRTIDLGLLVAVLLAAAVAVSAVGSGLSLRRFLRV